MNSDRIVQERDHFSSRELAILALIAVAGFAAIHWLVRNPQKAREIDLGILLGTQKASLAISDGCRRIGDQFRYIADKAGTQYNEIRSV